MAYLANRRTKVTERRHMHDYICSTNRASEVNRYYLSDEELNYYRSLPPPKKPLSTTAPQRIAGKKNARSGGETL